MPIGFSGKVLDRCWNKTYHRLRSGATKQTLHERWGGTKSNQRLQSEVTNQVFFIFDGTKSSRGSFNGDGEVKNCKFKLQ